MPVKPKSPINLILSVLKAEKSKKLEEKTALEKSIQAHQKCIDNLEKENEKLKEFSKDKCDTCKFKVNGVHQDECLECHRFYSDLYTEK